MHFIVIIRLGGRRLSRAMTLLPLFAPLCASTRYCSRGVCEDHLEGAAAPVHMPYGPHGMPGPRRMLESINSLAPGGDGVTGEYGQPRSGVEFGARDAERRCGVQRQDTKG